MDNLRKQIVQAERQVTLWKYRSLKLRQHYAKQLTEFEVNDQVHLDEGQIYIEAVVKSINWTLEDGLTIVVLTKNKELVTVKPEDPNENRKLTRPDEDINDSEFPLDLPEKE